MLFRSAELNHIIYGQFVVVKNKYITFFFALSVASSWSCTVLRISVGELRHKYNMVLYTIMGQDIVPCTRHTSSLYTAFVEVIHIMIFAYIGIKWISI